MNKRIISLTVNRDRFDVAVSPGQTLVEVLRNELGLTGTKRGCDSGACGACTVLIDGRAMLSCLTLAVDVEGRSITTIEGISQPDELHPIQQSFIDHGAIQCGFCSPGIIMTAKALLDKNPCPDDTAINAALAGTFCRCTGHIKIKEAIASVAGSKAEAKSNGS
mgnify:CR=1 FL=1